VKRKLYEGNSTVYEVVSPEGEHFVAKKVDVEDGQQEAEILNALGRHPHILQLHDSVVDSGAMFLLSPLITDCKAQIYQNPSLIRTCAMQMLQALQHIHKRGFVHLDLKMDNILFDGNQIVLIDFGHSLPAERVDEASVGTGSYSPPELHYDLSRDFSEKIDIWSAAVIIHEWWTGKRMFHVDSGDEFERLSKIEQFVDTMRKEGFFRFHDDVPLKGRDLALVRDLLHGMFEPTPKARTSTRQCLRNEWFADGKVEQKSPEKADDTSTMREASSETSSDSETSSETSSGCSGSMHLRFRQKIACQSFRQTGRFSIESVLAAV